MVHGYSLSTGDQRCFNACPAENLQFSDTLTGNPTVNNIIFTLRAILALKVLSDCYSTQGIPGATL